MTVLYAHICDYVTYTEGHKACLIGIFTEIRCRDKLAMPRSAVYVRVQFDQDLGPVSHEIEIRLVGPEKDYLESWTLKVKTEQAPPGGNFDAVVEIMSLKFSEPGPHCFEIVIDGIVDYELPFMVRRLEEGGQ